MESFENIVPEIFAENYLCPGRGYRYFDYFNDNLKERFFKHLAQTVGKLNRNLIERIEQKSIKLDLYLLLDQICGEVCRSCNGYEKCWGRNFYATYSEFFDLLVQLEHGEKLMLNNFKEQFRKKCFQQFKLVSVINKLAEEMRYGAENNFFERNERIKDEQMIREIIEQMKTDCSLRSEIEERIKSCLNHFGLQIFDLVIDINEKKNPEIHLRQQICYNFCECSRLIAEIFGELFAIPYSIWDQQCITVKSREEYTYSLVPERSYCVKTSVCKLSKGNNEASGDNQALHELRDGMFVAILSDGMGHGNRAFRESSSTVGVLENLIDNGIDRNFAIKMVNTMMQMRTPDEFFSTVDLTMIDLHNGKAEFLKIGAASTFVKRGREVEVINSTSLPVGILNAVDVEKTSMQLRNGDVVVMITDGIADSRREISPDDDWVRHALAAVDISGAEALGEYLLDLAVENNDGVPKDDMTVIVLRIEETKRTLN